MVSFTVIAAIAAFAGHAIAGALAPRATPMPNECNPGQKYCGFNLLNNGANNALWQQRAQDAQPGLDPGRVSDALYTCNADKVSLTYDDYCPRTGLACQPVESRKCGSGLNDCCAK